MFFHEFCIPCEVNKTQLRDRPTLLPHHEDGDSWSSPRAIHVSNDLAQMNIINNLQNADCHYWKASGPYPASNFNYSKVLIN